jgi:GH35 family endo-1,4-beta-xylanase
MILPTQSMIEWGPMKNLRRHAAQLWLMVFCLGPFVVFGDEPDSRVAARVPLKDAFKDHFKIGAALNRSITTGAAFRRSQELVNQDIEAAKFHFNQIVPENDMKWQLIHPRPGVDGYNFGPADAFVEFGQKNHMEIAGHTLVWHSQTPAWVFEGNHEIRGAAEKSPDGNEAKKESERTPDTSDNGNPPGASGSGNQPGSRRGAGGRGGFGAFRGFDLNGPHASRDELLERMREHIHSVVARYKGKVKVWDVVNEALADNGPDVLRRSPWSVIIGPDFVAKAFEFAHEADPEAVLRYNDYGLENPGKRRKLIELIKSLKEQKIPVMAIGSQAHCNVSTTFEAMDQALAEIETLGLPIHITELDVNTATGGQRGTGAEIGNNTNVTQGGLVEDADKRLADAYAGLFRAFIKHKESVQIVTFWGVNDAVSWRAQGRPLLFDGNNRPKPAFEAVIQTAAGR